jgi:MoxR-like ATPase
LKKITSSDTENVKVPEPRGQLLLNERQTWIDSLIKEISVGLYEREEIVAVSLLSVIAGQSVFLYGPPGTAKSLIARRIKCAFQDASYFEYLMQRFSTPEDVFGPVSIAELRQDKYVRKTENYLPSAEIAFLDEIWKSSPAILNTLLTIVNERTFRNGQKIVDVPLRGLIAASNEIPEPNKGLDALYDRFILRMEVMPLKKWDDFEKMIASSNVSNDVKPRNPITAEKWDDIRKESADVAVPEQIFTVIKIIRLMIEKHNQSNPDSIIYVSDRRWQKAISILKVSAYLNGHQEVTTTDTLLLRHMLWSSNSNMEVVHGIVEHSAGLSDNNGPGEAGGLKQDLADLIHEITEEVFYTEDVVDTRKFNDKVYAKVSVTIDPAYNRDWEVSSQHQHVYLPVEPILCSGRTGEYLRIAGLDENGNPLKRSGTGSHSLKFYLNRDGSVSASAGNVYSDAKVVSVNKNILHKAWTPKHINDRLRDSFIAEAKNLKKTVETAQSDIEKYYEQQKSTSYSVFVPEHMSHLVLSNLRNRIDELKEHSTTAESIVRSLSSSPSDSPLFTSSRPIVSSKRVKKTDPCTVLMYNKTDVEKYSKKSHGRFYNDGPLEKGALFP